MKGLKDKKPVLLSKGAVPDNCLNIQNCSAVEDQGQLGSCTAQAVVGLKAYMMRRGRGSYTDGSRPFQYKVTRNLLHWTGDAGGYVRTAVTAAVPFGVPPEEYWAYDISRFDDEPGAFLYSFAASYQAVNCARLDTPGTTANDVIERVRRTSAAGFGVVFAFSVYDSLSNDANIPVPDPQRDKLQGGHAVMAAGYDVKHTVGGKTVPSLVIRNSWGTSWGKRGVRLPADGARHAWSRA